MKKSELILVLVALAAVVYGATEYWVLGKKHGPGETPTIREATLRIQAIADQAGEKLAALSPTADEMDLAYIMTRSESPWSRDPFIRPGESDGTARDQGAGITLIYSGFIRAGQITFGIINGMEYRVGDQLIGLDYSVLEITPSRVTLGTRSNRQIVLYMEEDPIDQEMESK